MSAPEGWTWLINATKWHYFRDGRSLCGRWMHLGSAYETDGDQSVDNCAACRKKRLAEITYQNSRTLDPAGTVGP